LRSQLNSLRVFPVKVERGRILVRIASVESSKNGI
jgi:hypothetical protein